jgi:polyamine oxidase
MVKTIILSSLIASLFLAADAKTYNTKVVILGGGVSGISAALNLTDAGITDFMMVEARDELGGRAQNAPFAGTNVELGCNWVQGLGTNPINQMAIKYKLKTAFSDSADVVWYDEDGKYNGTEIYDRANEALEAVNELGSKYILLFGIDL